MARIEHTFPAGVLPEDGSVFGLFDPGQRVTEYDTGPRHSRSWFEYPLRSYRWGFVYLPSTRAQLPLLEAFLTHTRLAALPFWLCEPISCTHPQLVVGPLGDGTRTSFVVPCLAAASETVFVSGTRYAASRYTLHAASNLLTDAQANAVGGTTGMEVYGTATLSQVTSPCADGATSFKVDPTGTQANYGVTTTAAGRPTITASKKYTVFGAFRGAGDYVIKGQFYQDATPGADFSDTETGSADEWTMIYATSTAGASDNKLNLTAYRSDSSSNAIAIGCLGVFPGDLTQWFLPSVAPSVIEFASAPADRSRITLAATGKRCSRVRVDRTSVSWRMYSPGSALPESMTMFEEIEV